MYATIADYRKAPFQKRTLIVLASFGLYFILAVLLYPAFGPNALALSVIPVLFSAWLFGIKIGILGWVFVVLGNTLLQLVWSVSIAESFFIGLPGIISVFPFAVITGYISNLSLQYQGKIEELEKNNEMLEKEMSMRKDFELLFSEVNHRIKNNLAMITGILEMEAMRSTNPETSEILDDVKTRIYSVAAVHEQLYKHNISNEIPFKIFMEKLLDHIQVNSGKGEKVKICSDIDSLSLDTKLALNLALIINELVTNALKYAFTDQENGEINVSLKSNKDSLELSVKDNGIGLPENFDPYNTDITQSIGFHMITNLVQQWDGELTFENNGGARFFITFKNDNLN